MISSASSFLSFSFRFFILQILRFINMRDWLAIPLSPTSASVKNSDDEYDIVNRATTTEEESDGIEEEEVEAADNAESDADKFTLVSILNAFIDIGKEQLKTRSLSISSSGASSQYNDSNERSIQQLEVKNKPIIITNREIDCNKENKICIGAITDDEDGYNHDEDDIDDDDSINNDDDEEEQEFDNNEYISELKRTLSNSSLASSTDTDNSTPASSQIMGPSTSKQLFNMSTINKSLVEVSLLSHFYSPNNCTKNSKLLDLLESWW